MKNKIYAFTGLVSLLSLVGCGGATEPSAAPTVTVTATVTAGPSEPAEESNNSETAEGAVESSFGKKIVSGGVTLTVKSAQIVDTVAMNRSGYKEGSGYEKITNEKPSKGGKFLRIDTVVENSGKTSMDLTCGYPVRIKAYDSQQREFDTIDSLHEVTKNPGCNDMLQPGFSDKMSYIFMVPKEAELIGFSFDDTDEEDRETPGNFAFTKSL